MVIVSVGCVYFYHTANKRLCSQVIWHVHGCMGHLAFVDLWGRGRDSLPFVQVQLLMCWQCLQVISQYNRRNSYMFSCVVLLCMWKCVCSVANTIVLNKCQVLYLIVWCTRLCCNFHSVCVFLVLKLWWSTFVFTWVARAVYDYYDCQMTRVGTWISP